MVYDNAILNHPELLNALLNSSQFSLSEIINIFRNIDEDFINQFCLGGDITVLEQILSIE